MNGDDIREKIKELPPKAWAGIGLCVVLALVLIWVYWPTSVAIDPNAQRALDAQKNDPAANPPVADVPPPTDGPRRRAAKAK